jgi:hypothetical protein
MTDMVEIRKSIPVIAEVDVLVVGGGHAGCTAAIAAARAGADAMLIDRFGTLGGGMGPGLIGGSPNLELPAPWQQPGMPGIPGEFVRRCETYTNAPLLSHYFRDAQVISYVWLTMMQESGVSLLLNTWAVDPIMEGTRVIGLIVENKSGTGAIRAKVVVDATGDADVAYRAGVPMDDGTGYSHPGLFFALGRVDLPEYFERVRKNEPSADDLAWAEARFDEIYGDARHVGYLRSLVTFFRPAWEAGEYRIVRKIGDVGYVTCDHGLFKSVSGVQEVNDPLPTGRYGLIGALTGVWGPKTILSGDAEVMTELEVGVRMYIFETAEFLRRRVPGFGDSYLHIISPYFHARGGRSAISEHPVTREDIAVNPFKDDVVFLGDDPERRVQAAGEASHSRWKPYDFPYRQFLPRGVDGLLVTGRAAIIQPPVMRVRWMVFMMGQAVGVAAALAARDGKTPRAIDVRELQQILHAKYHVPLGDALRLQQLGLA